MKATKEQFKTFVIIQRTNTINMLDPQVRELCECTAEQHTDMCTNYVKYQEAYNVK